MHRQALLVLKDHNAGVTNSNVKIYKLKKQPDSPHQFILNVQHTHKIFLWCYPIVFNHFKLMINVATFGDQMFSNYLINVSVYIQTYFW